MINEELVREIRRTIILKNEYKLEIPESVELFRGIYNYYALQNPNYSFLKGNPRDINFITFDPTREQYEWLVNFNTSKPFILYTEEMDVVFPYGDEGQKNILRKKMDSSNFIGFASHIEETSICAGRCFNCSSYYLPLPVKYMDLSDSLLNRTEEELILIYTGSWRCGHQQKYCRGIHIADKAFSIAKKKCKNLRMIFVERFSDGLYCKYEYPADVLVISEDLSFLKLAYLLCASDIFIMPSHQMHVNSFYEAMQYGLGIITLDEFGIREIITNNGVKIEMPCETSVVVEDYGKLESVRHQELINPDSDISKQLSELVAEQIIHLYKNRKEITKFRHNSVKNIQFHLPNHINKLCQILSRHPCL